MRPLRWGRWEPGDGEEEEEDGWEQEPDRELVRRKGIRNPRRMRTTGCTHPQLKVPSLRSHTPTPGRISRGDEGKALWCL